MRGVITVDIKRRKINTSWQYKDKWDNVDTLKLAGAGKGVYLTSSKNYPVLKHLITRDELAFVRLIVNTYGPGDYSIKIYGKGKNKGFRRFWDGLISKDGKFLRRKEASMLGTAGASAFSSQNMFTYYTESFIGKYMKTKTPGIWHNYI